MTGLMNALLLALTLSCQQAERREAAGEVAATLPARPVPVPTADPAVRAAQVELDDSHPALATRRLAPVLASRTRRTPEAVLVAARAAAAWGGWTEVIRLLASEPWLQTQFQGEGLELLARGALEEGNAEAARSYADSALRAGSAPTSRAVRLVLLARALDRLDVRDTAAANYARAAEALPIVRDWLLLRAAGATASAPARERIYGNVQGEAARARVPYTEAQALERFGPAESAAAAYAKLGDKPSALRLRLAAVRDEASRSALLVELLDYIRHSQGDDLRRAIEVLDAAFPTPDDAAQLTVARRAGAMGVSARAVSGFERVPATLLTDADVLSWARALIATGKSSDAAKRLGARRFAAAAAPQAAFLRARALIRSGAPTAARATLQRVVTTNASTAVAADALYLLADLSTDAGSEAAARDLYQRACVHVPAGAYSDDACFRAGIISFALGDATRAARTFDDGLKRFPGSVEKQAMTYWSGRAWARAGNAVVAKQRWNAVVAASPSSYYGSASAKRLGAAPWVPAAQPLPRATRAAAMLSRADALEQLGMDAEQRFELDALEGDVSSFGSALLTGAALLDHDEAPRAARLGRKALALANASDSTRGDPRAYMLMYPLAHRDALLERSRANGLDPAFVAAIIRQESGWYPRAVSVAGARGLMQVMPSVGQQIARGRGFPEWDPALLFDPDVNLEFGTSHLRGALADEGNPARALAAYNAGASRVHRWSSRAGVADPELFIERIPFEETRDYVRVVLRNAEIYRALYGLTR